MASKPAGADWTKQFPTSKSLTDLKGGFASSMKQFAAALKAAGVKMTISATYRPPERAYLMHFSWLVAKGMDPAKVPPMRGVDIDWTCKGGGKDAKSASPPATGGKPDNAEAVKAAKEMVRAYAIAYAPALTSRHTQGLAIDMSLSWSGTLSIKDAKGKDVSIASSPRDGGNKELQAVGATYGVVKLKSDPPHWSSDGH